MKEELNKYNISGRLRRALVDLGIETIQDVLETHWSKIGKCRGCGTATIVEFRRFQSLLRGETV